MKVNFIKIFFICIGCIILAGCNNYAINVAHPNSPDYAPVAPQQPSVAPTLTGSLYQTNSGLDALYVDLRAYKIGDLLTVVLLENTTANKAANTTASKTTAVEEDNPTLFGSSPQFNVPKFIPLASNKNNNLQFNLNSKNSFTGNGTSAQNNSLLGSISVTVANVLPNGNLVIRGEKWISLNQGSEYIRLTGIVRPYDIDASNNILSTKIADPRITYKGTGVLAEANQEGWLARFFNSPLYLY